MSTERYQSANQRFAAFFNRLAKARLAGTPLAPALADAVGHELSRLNPAVDLPPEAARLWTGFLDSYITFSGAVPSDPLARLRDLPEADAERAMEQIGDIQQILADMLRKGRR